MTSSSDDIDAQVLRLKEELADFKPTVLGIARLMLWENPVEAAVLAAVPTLFFSLIYYLDASLLTSLSVFGICLLCIDFGLPLALNYSGLAAKPEDENILFEKACNRLVVYKASIWSCLMAFKNLRKDMPAMLYGLAIIILAAIAWIGACINNIFLAYLTAMGLLFYPGAQKHKMFQSGIGCAIHLVKVVFGKIQTQIAQMHKKKEGGEKKAK